MKSICNSPLSILELHFFSPLGLFSLIPLSIFPINLQQISHLVIPQPTSDYTIPVRKEQKKPHPPAFSCQKRDISRSERPVVELWAIAIADHPGLLR